MLFLLLSLFACEEETKNPLAVDDDGDGYSEFDGDCNDQDSRVNPGESEICDSVDNNCNGEVDEGAIALALAGRSPGSTHRRRTGRRRSISQRVGQHLRVCVFGC